jgi:L-iditol 2-dehydrogenase
VKAAYVTAPEVVELREVPVPACPPDGVLLAVRACGICGSDLRRYREGPHPAGPVIVGHEFAGIIVEVGRDVLGYRPGDHLAVAPDVHCLRCRYCTLGLYNLCDDQRQIGITPGYDGGLAEYAVVPGDALRGGVVHGAPVALTFPQAALAEPLSSVLACHADLGTGLGDTVLVMGAGPIGCLHTAIAHLRGARVMLSEPSDVRRRMAEPFAPELVLDPSSEDVAAAVRDFTDGLGVDSAICANPVAATHAQAVAAVRKRGTVVLFGGLPKASPQTTLDANRIHYDEIRVVGSFSYHPEFHRRALELLERGGLDSDLVITHAFALDEVGEAFRTAAGGEALKVMVTVEPATDGGRGPGEDRP